MIGIPEDRLIQEFGQEVEMSARSFQGGHKRTVSQLKAEFAGAQKRRCKDFMAPYEESGPGAPGAFSGA